MCFRQVLSKRRKTRHSEISSTRKSQSTRNKTSRGKEKAFERKYIPIPIAEAIDDEDEDLQLSDQDLDVLHSASFLKQLDHKGIARSALSEFLSLSLTGYASANSGAKTNLSDCVNSTGLFVQHENMMTSHP